MTLLSNMHFVLESNKRGNETSKFCGAIFQLHNDNLLFETADILVKQASRNSKQL